MQTYIKKLVNFVFVISYIFFCDYEQQLFVRNHEVNFEKQYKYCSSKLTATDNKESLLRQRKVTKALHSLFYFIQLKLDNCYVLIIQLQDFK